MADGFRKIPQGPPKILFVDIERVIGTAVTFDTKVRGGFIPARDFLTRPRNLCFAAKWYDEKRAKFFATWESDDPDYFAKESWDLFDQADIVVTYYGTGADIPWFRQSWLQAELGEPSPSIHVDLYYTTRKFGLLSSSMEEACRFVGLPGKTGRYDKWEALDAEAGDVKAQKRIKKYNLGDVGKNSLEGLFDKYRPYLTQINYGNWFPGAVCSKCGGDHLEWVGYKVTGAARYDTYRCDDCKGLTRDKKAISSPDMRGI
jgi:hypothetical protein